MADSKPLSSLDYNRYPQPIRGVANLLMGITIGIKYLALTVLAFAYIMLFTLPGLLANFVLSLVKFPEQASEDNDGLMDETIREILTAHIPESLKAILSPVITALLKEPKLVDRVFDFLWKLPEKTDSSAQKPTTENMIDYLLQLFDEEKLRSLALTGAKSFVKAYAINSNVLVLVKRCLTTLFRPLPKGIINIGLSLLSRPIQAVLFPVGLGLFLVANLYNRMLRGLPSIFAPAAFSVGSMFHTTLPSAVRLVICFPLYCYDNIFQKKLSAEELAEKSSSAESSQGESSQIQIMTQQVSQGSIFQNEKPFTRSVGSTVSNDTFTSSFGIAVRGFTDGSKLIHALMGFKCKPDSMGNDPQAQAEIQIMMDGKSGGVAGSYSFLFRPNSRRSHAAALADEQTKLLRLNF